VVVEVLVGVLVLDVVPVRVVALLVLVVVELSTVVVGALSNVEVEDVVVSVCTEARGGDFLMSLWDFRIDAESFVESVLEVFRSDSLAFSWPIAINGSPIAWVNENSTISIVSAAIESIARRRDSKCCIQPPNAASPETSPWCG
jgi:hypothetical protein